jgi:hypothetical protein
VIPENLFLWEQKCRIYARLALMPSARHDLLSRTSKNSPSANGERPGSNNRDERHVVMVDKQVVAEDDDNDTRSLTNLMQGKRRHIEREGRQN